MDKKKYIQFLFCKRNTDAICRRHKAQNNTYVIPVVIVVISGIVGVVGIVAVLEVSVIIAAIIVVVVVVGTVIIVVVLPTVAVLADVVVVVPVRTGLAEGIGHPGGLAGLARVERGAEGDLGPKGQSVDVVAVLDVLLLAPFVVVVDGAGVVGVEVELQLGRGEGFAFHATDLGVQLLAGVGRFLEEDAVKIPGISGTVFSCNEM